MSLQAMADATRRLDELSCARIVGNAADAVHAAQAAQKGQPLGTVTPAAIVVAPDGSVALRPGAPAAGYTAPERLRGDASDRRADVFALGAVLWEALVRERLFTGPDDASIRRAVVGAVFRAPSELNANVPAELDAICKKALAHDPADRYPSAKVMAAEIDAVLGDAGYPESNAQIAAYVARGAPKLAKTQLLGSLADASSSRPASQSPPMPEGSSSLATTSFLGSNAMAPSAADPLDAGPLPPPPIMRPAVALPAPFRSSPAIGSGAGPAIEAPSFGPPEMPAGAASSSAPLAAHPQPPARTSVAPAEAAATPQLPAHLAIQPPVPVLSMPPGITVAPSLPPAVLQTADGELDDEPLAEVGPPEPIEIKAMRHRDNRTGTSRDVLAGWGWTTGASQIVDDTDHFDDHARASRKRLLIAIGGALGAVLLIAAAAFAFRGAAPVETVPATTAAPSATAAIAVSPTAPPATAPDTAPANQPPAAPPAPDAVKPVPPSAELARAVPVPAPSPPPAVANTLAAELPKAEPPKAEPPKAEPPKAEPPKAEPPKATAPKPPAKKLEPHKPEPKVALKAPDKAPKRAPARPAIKAQPVDPYAIPTERSKLDPAAAYRTGLQQYAHGDTTGALATFRGSLASNPGFAPTWRGLGLVYEKLGNKGQARAAFKRYLQLAPAAGDAEQIRDRMGRLGS